MLNEKTEPKLDEEISNAVNTDQVPQGVQNFYLTTTGGSTDNLATMPNFQTVSNTLNSHLANTSNPHSQILAGLRTHQTQLSLTGNITLNNTNSVDCLLIPTSTTATCNITIPNETTIGYTFATHASFSAFRLYSGTLTVTAAAGVTFTNVGGSTVTFPSVGTSYYLFIKQATNQWAVVTFTAAASTTTLTGDVTGSGIGTVPTTLANTGVTAGTYGNGTQVGQFTVNAKGLITSATNVPISGGSGFTWNEVTTPQTMSADNGYITNSVALVPLTLPTTAARGTTIQVVGKGIGGWQIKQNSVPSQIIYFGNQATTVGNTGFLASTNQHDAITLLCTTANTEFTVVNGPMGNITYV